MRIAAVAVACGRRGTGGGQDSTLDAPSEDGNLYVLDRAGHEIDRVFLGRSIEEAYTPTAIDPAGRVYAQNNGQLYALAH
jgi:hypothetical protein